MKVSEQERLDRDLKALRIYQRQLYSSDLTDVEVSERIARAKELINMTR
tara:strand:- start:332 stop:478 length:147 start_codon:yes stop_codon:yes gene_type:complete